MKTPTAALIKDVAALKQKKFREENGRILVEARHPVEEALRVGLTLRDVFFQKDALPESLPAVDLPVEPYQVDASAMARMASTNSPPPCLAVFDAPKPMQKLQGSRVLVLDEIQDPGNLGTLARSAVAFGIDTLVLAGDCVEAYNPKVIRSSAGLIFALPVLSTSKSALGGYFKEADWTVYLTTGKPGAQSYREAEYTGHCAIVLGNEGRGVSEDLFTDFATQALTIPMSDRVESLNVGVSGSIILAEMAAQWKRAIQVAGR